MSNISHARSELMLIAASEEVIQAVEKALTFLVDDFDSGAHGLGVSMLKSLRRRVKKNATNYIVTGEDGIPESALFYPLANYLNSLPWEVTKQVVEYLPELFDSKSISPLRGTDDEWYEVYIDVNETTLQNKRCGSVFKSSDRFNNQPYDIDGIVFNTLSSDFGSWMGYTSSGSLTPITFPYTPVTKHLRYYSEVSNILLEETMDAKSFTRLMFQVNKSGINPQTSIIDNSVVFTSKEDADEVFRVFISDRKLNCKLDDTYSFTYVEDGFASKEQLIALRAERLVALLGYDYSETEEGNYILQSLEHRFILVPVMIPNKFYQKWEPLIIDGKVIYTWILSKYLNHDIDYCVDRLSHRHGKIHEYMATINLRDKESTYVPIAGDTDDYLYQQRRHYNFSHPNRKPSTLTNTCEVVAEEPDSVVSDTPITLTDMFSGKL